jgi:hypothetical protein
LDGNFFIAIDHRLLSFVVGFVDFAGFGELRNPVV